MQIIYYGQMNYKAWATVQHLWMTQLFTYLVAESSVPHPPCSIYNFAKMINLPHPIPKYWAYDTWNSNSAEIFVECTYSKFYHLIFNRSEVIVLSNKQTNKQTNKHTHKQTKKQRDLVKNIPLGPVCYAGEKIFMASILLVHITCINSGILIISLQTLENHQ